MPTLLFLALYEKRLFFIILGRHRGLLANFNYFLSPVTLPTFYTIDIYNYQIKANYHDLTAKQ